MHVDGRSVEAHRIGGERFSLDQEALVGLAARRHRLAPDEWYLVDSSNPKVAGFDELAVMYADLMYELARQGRVKR